MMKPLRENFWLQFILTTVAFLAIGILFDSFDGERKFTFLYFAGKTIGALIFGTLMCIVFNPKNPFKKKKTV